MCFVHAEGEEGTPKWLKEGRWPGDACPPAPRHTDRPPFSQKKTHNQLHVHVPHLSPQLGHAFGACLLFSWLTSSRGRCRGSCEALRSLCSCGLGNLKAGPS